MHTKKVTILPILLLSLVPNSTTAQDSWHHQKCIDQSDFSTSAMRECNFQEFDAQDGRLNGAYRRLMAILPEQSRQTLRETQRRWISYRDKKCNFVTETHGPGTIAMLARDSCRIDETRLQADWLVSQYDYWLKK